MRYLLLISLLALSACTGMAPGITPVSNFDADRYLGRWYEIARLDHSFERGLSSVTADYSLRDDGGIRVINRGFSAPDNNWDSAEGKAYFVGDRDTGHLKVSFFGPFYGSYVVFDLDQVDYQQAYVGSYNHDYLWLLSRTPTISEADKNRFLESAADRGYDSDAIIWVDQSKPQ